jgi:diguanylate cyclase (GGDEF)-like protein
MPATDVASAQALAERLCARVSRHELRHEGQPIALRVSIGASALQGEADTLEALLARADQAMYRAKREGRDRVTSQPATSDAMAASAE